jgi:soluble lytic murein transglycosylase-like protein
VTRARFIVWIALAFLVSSAAPAAAMVGSKAPSRTQLARLSHFSKYIDYFASLGYGPEKSKISPTYIRALIVAESSAEPRARSHMGARGLSQIMLETGKLAAREILAGGMDYEYVDERRLRWLSAEDLYDPAINILIACHLSATYLDRFLGRTDLVVSAWNAGPEAVVRYGNRPPPYRETRQLLARVHGYMLHFDDGRYPGWQTSSWDSGRIAGSRWGGTPHLPSRDFVIAARRAAQRASVPRD